jgi:hypothetical protein
VCFIVAMRVTSQRWAITLQIASRLTAGIALPLIGYETACRSTATSILETKSNYAVGILFITAGVLCLGDLIAKAFDK